MQIIPNELTSARDPITGEETPCFSKSALARANTAARLRRRLGISASTAAVLTELPITTITDLECARVSLATFDDATAYVDTLHRASTTDIPADELTAIAIALATAEVTPPS